MDLDLILDFVVTLFGYVRYENLQVKVFKRGQSLEEVWGALEGFLGPAAHFDDWYQQVVETLDSADKLEAEQLGFRIEEIARQRDQRREDFEAMMQNGRNLVTKKDIADATPIREKIKSKHNKTTISPFSANNLRYISRS